MPANDGYFGTDADPMNYPGGMTAAAAFRAMQEGRGGPQVAPPTGNAASSDDLITRILRALGIGGGSSMPASGPGSVQMAALAPPAGGDPTDRGTFGPQSPAFPPPPPQYKPATKLASASEIGKMINAMIGAPEAPAWLDPDELNPYDPTGGVATEPFSYRVDAPSLGQEYFDLLQSQKPVRRPTPIYLGSETPMAARPRPRPRQATFGGALPPDLRGMSVGEGTFARGGAIPHLMRGGYPDLYDRPIRRTFDSGGAAYVDNSYHSEGGGRADDVNAKLSRKEYVMDAESMALLGDGDPDKGADKMDAMRNNLRKHKGKALAKGKFSPNAKKAAEEYLVSSPKRYTNNKG
jgi:hypothetical protein